MLPKKTSFESTDVLLCSGVYYTALSNICNTWSRTLFLDKWLNYSVDVLHASLMKTFSKIQPANTK